MSRHLVNLVMGAARLGGASKRQLMHVLADHTNETTGACFPGIELLEEETELSRRTILRGLSDLELEGLLTVNRKVDRRQKQRNSYQLNADKLAAMQRSCKPLQDVEAHEPEEPAKPFISARVTPIEDSICAKSDVPYVPNSTSICAKSASLNRKNRNEQEYEQEEILEPLPGGEKLILAPPAFIAPTPSRHALFKEALERYYRETTGRPMPWGPADAKQLKNLLDACPWMNLSEFEIILGNRKLSQEVVHSQRPLRWLSRATDYLSGPLNPFQQPLNGANNGKLSKIELSASTSASAGAIADRMDPPAFLSGRVAEARAGNGRILEGSASSSMV